MKRLTMKIYTTIVCRKLIFLLWRHSPQFQLKTPSTLQINSQHIFCNVSTIRWFWHYFGIPVHVLELREGFLFPLRYLELSVPYSNKAVNERDRFSTQYDQDSISNTSFVCVWKYIWIVQYFLMDSQNHRIEEDFT